MAKQKNSKSNAYIIAEAGVNHNGSLDMALRLIDVAAEAGADAVKFQTFKTELVISRYASKADYHKLTTASTESQFDMVKKLELDESSHKRLVAHCEKRKIEFISTPFDLESIDLLVDKLKVTRLKMPSGEITNAPLLLKAARSGKPIILSTGMSTLAEVESALGVLAYGYLETSAKPSMKAFYEAYCSEAGQKALKEKVVILHCTTEYPAPYEDVNLQVMDTMRQAFGLPVGYSDHTNGIAIPIGAIARGAVLIEKHFTLDRNLPGPDHKASLEPDELRAMVTAIRHVEKALGTTQKIPAKSEMKNRDIARKCLVAGRDIKKGEIFTEQNISVKRPGDGISPMYYWNILGKIAGRDYIADEKIIEYAS
jgi:N-acetylneuraminate synthase